MKCPVCNIDMIVVEYNKIELDYCMRCAGVWFDSGELNLLLEKVPGKEASLTLVSQAKAAETRRKCPICSQKLDKGDHGRSA